MDHNINASDLPLNAAQHPSQNPQKIDFKKIAAIGIGNFMEWFDFAIYGYFAATIGLIFFPSKAPNISLLSSLAVFAVGFIARPLGAFILGPIGDKFGRKVVLMITVFGMGVFTTLIGLLPSYASIGILSPILLIIFRFMQGMMVGGEWSSAGIFLVESAEPHRRALAASVITTTAGLAFLIGTAAAALINQSMDKSALISWGWRIPFVLSIVMTFIALYIRQKLTDTPVFEALSQRHTKPSDPQDQGRSTNLADAFSIAFSFAALFGVSLYYFISYMNNHLVSTVHLSPTRALVLCSIALIAYVIFNPIVGLILDKYGRRHLLIFAASGLTLLAYPIFFMINSGNDILIITALLLLAALVAITAVCDVVLLVEIFPAATRSANAAIGHNLALALLAGPGPFIAAYLSQSTHNPNMPAAYLMFISLICLVILFKKLPETQAIQI